VGKGFELKFRLEARIICGAGVECRRPPFQPEDDVKKRFLPLFLLFLGCAVAQGQGKPVPPGRQELKNYQAAHPDVPPQIEAPRFDPAKLQTEAAELSDLARSIPEDIEAVTKGVLPKDTLEKLKRIEKITKHLRGEIAP
jgi:hypothetical protein